MILRLIRFFLIVELLKQKFFEFSNTAKRMEVMQKDNMVILSTVWKSLLKGLPPGLQSISCSNRAYANRNASKEYPKSTKCPHFQRSNKGSINSLNIFSNSIQNSTSWSFIIKWNWELNQSINKIHMEAFSSTDTGLEKFLNCTDWTNVWANQNVSIEKLAFAANSDCETTKMAWDRPRTL